MSPEIRSHGRKRSLTRVNSKRFLRVATRKYHCLFALRYLELNSSDNGEKIMQRLQTFLKQNEQVKNILVRWLLCQRTHVEVAEVALVCLP
jgi:hypothetical protein